MPSIFTILADEGQDPQVMMRYSDDGGHTWSNERWKSLGKKGEYKTRIKWNRLGIARDRVYELRITDDVKIAIIGGTIEAKPLKG